MSGQILIFLSWNSNAHIFCCCCGVFQSLFAEHMKQHLLFILVRDNVLTGRDETLGYLPTEFSICHTKVWHMQNSERLLFIPVRENVLTGRSGAQPPVHCVFQVSYGSKIWEHFHSARFLLESLNEADKFTIPFLICALWGTCHLVMNG